VETFLPNDGEYLPRRLSQRAERELICRVQSGRYSEREHAVSVLLTAFKPFLSARTAPFRGYAVDAADLEQEARAAFVRAVERFDLSRTTRLSSYASRWVDGALRRFVAGDWLIRVPQRTGRELAQVRRVRLEFVDAFGKEPTLVELEKGTGLSSARIVELMQVPEATVSLGAIANGEAGFVKEARPGGWARAAAVLADEAEEEVTSDSYEPGEVSVLVDEYQSLRSQLEIRTSAFDEPRLRRRGARIANLVRLTDVDRALQRASDRQFVALEFAALRDLPLRELESLFNVRHTTFADRRRAGVTWIARWLNGHEPDSRVRRFVFWRRLFAWNLGELRIHGEPVAFEVWARMADARELWTGTRSIPVRALAVFGSGWLLTPEVLGRSIDWDDTESEEVAVGAS
jgi:hypothetical protein